MNQLDRIEKQNKETLDLLRSHIDKSNEQHLKMSNQLTRVETTQGSEKIRMDKHEKAIEGLKFWRNINIAGILSALGLPWFK